MDIEQILPRLQKVRRKGNGHSYTACCPAHDDKNPSFVITQLDDGRIIFHCSSGCNAEEIVSALGYTFADLYPENKIRNQYREYRSLAQSFNKSSEHEKIILNICENRRAKGERLSEKELERERQAYLRTRQCKT